MWNNHKIVIIIFGVRTICNLLLIYVYFLVLCFCYLLANFKTNIRQVCASLKSKQVIY